MPRQSNARERLIEAAATLFRRYGFNGVGLNRILAESGAPKGSFYHHFPKGKDDLAAAAVTSAAAVITDMIDRAFDNAETFEAGAASLSRKIARLFESSGWLDGCPVASVLLETSQTSEALADVAKSVFDQWIDQVAAHARRLGVEGDPRHKATKLLIALEGAWLLARAQRSIDPILITPEMI